VVEEEPDPTLRLSVSAFIPEEYVADSHQRLSLYKRLSSCGQLGDLAMMHGEIEDRYGHPPDPVERLFELMQVRLLAKQLRLNSIVEQPNALVVTFDPKATVPEAAVQLLMDRYKKRLRFVSPLSFELQMPHEDWSLVFPELNAILQTLYVCGTNRQGSHQDPH
jgi:transcription-repair coupling factor (superfamily II helicase)